jgi:tight adherence protein B
MGATLAPVAAVGGAILAVALIFYALWEPFSHRLERYGLAFKRDLDVGGLKLRPEAFGSTLLAVGIAVWSLLLLFTHPGIGLGVFELLATALAVIWGGKAYLRLRVARTIARFSEQLEGTLRQFGSSIRVGLGLRQALIHVAEQSESPMNRELTRVVGATNLGLSLSDALDDLAVRIPTQETNMLARVIRVQTQTGSDLAGILDALADTIRDRRRFGRRVSAITAQARASAWVVGALPIVVFLLVCLMQPDMRAASFGTGIGRIFLAVGLSLDALAALVLLNITRIDA